MTCYPILRLQRGVATLIGYSPLRYVTDHETLILDFAPTLRAAGTIDVLTVSTEFLVAETVK